MKKKTQLINEIKGGGVVDIEYVISDFLTIKKPNPLKQTKIDILGPSRIKGNWYCRTSLDIENYSLFSF